MLPAWVASKITVANDEDELYRRMNADDFDPYQEAVVYARDAGRVPATSSGDAGVEGRATGYLKVAVNAPEPALLVVSEAYHWNWIALVNGAEVTPVVVDGALLGVPLPPGQSAVELSYRPSDLYAGALIAGATLAATIALLAWSRRR